MVVMNLYGLISQTDIDDLIGPSDTYDKRI